MSIRDDVEIILASTGNLELAEQFGAWYQSVMDNCCRMIGIDPEAYNAAMLEIEQKAAAAAVEGRQ